MILLNITHHLGIPLPNEVAFSKVKNSYIKSTYYSIDDDYGSNVNYIFINRDWFYTTEYADSGSGGKAMRRSLPENLQQ